MKTSRTVLIAVTLLLGGYLGGYWLFFKWDLASKLSPHDDPFQSSDTRRLIADAFEPLREVDLQVTHDLPLRSHLTGYWTSSSTPDFVRLDSEYNCKFQLGEFAYEGPVKYDRDYSGFYADFSHQGSIYIFILSYSGCIETTDRSDDEAIAFIGHDPKPLHRETDYLIQLTKIVEQGAASGGNKPKK